MDIGMVNVSNVPCLWSHRLGLRLGLGLIAYPVCQYLAPAAAGCMSASHLAPCLHRKPATDPQEALNPGQCSQSAPPPPSCWQVEVHILTSILLILRHDHDHGLLLLPKIALCSFFQKLIKTAFILL